MPQQQWDKTTVQSLTETNRHTTRLNETNYVLQKIDPVWEHLMPSDRVVSCMQLSNQIKWTTILLCAQKLTRELANFVCRT